MMVMKILVCCRYVRKQSVKASKPHVTCEIVVVLILDGLKCSMDQGKHLRREVKKVA